MTDRESALPTIDEVTEALSVFGEATAQYQRHGTLESGVAVDVAEGDVVDLVEALYARIAELEAECDASRIGADWCLAALTRQRDRAEAERDVARREAEGWRKRLRDLTGHDQGNSEFPWELPAPQGEKT